MNIEIFELSEEEILEIAGGGQIDPQVAQTMGIDYPVIENNPPG